MNNTEIESFISKMLQDLYELDKFLLANDVTERAITHKMGMYLERHFPNEWDVDCEFNRMGFMEHGSIDYTSGDYFAKTVNLSGTFIPDEDDQGSRVYPDIIVHKRGTTNNLLIIEVKVKSKGASKSHDYKKLKAYKSYLKYKFAYFIELGSTLEECIIDPT